jgi:hypothetical protein
MSINHNQSVTTMTTHEVEPGTIVNIRLKSYTSIRHYGGREITTHPHYCKAEFICKQCDHSNLVILAEDCDGKKAGYKIAVQDIDFNLP